jgi:hypothetical protein
MMAPPADKVVSWPPPRADSTGHSGARGRGDTPARCRFRVVYFGMTVADLIDAELADTAPCSCGEPGAVPVARAGPFAARYDRFAHLTRVRCRTRCGRCGRGAWWVVDLPGDLTAACGGEGHRPADPFVCVGPDA